MKAGHTLAPLAALLLSACTVGPNYVKPHVQVPAAYSAAPATPGARKRGVSLGTWWTRFHDPQLNALIARALKGNLDLKAAVSRIREAREQVVVATASGLPTLHAGGIATGAHLGRNGKLDRLAQRIGGSTPDGRSGAPGDTFSGASAGLYSLWEPDLFGGVRRSVQAAQARAEQAVWTWRDGEVSISAEVASDYFQLRALQQQRAVAKKQIAQQRKTLALLKALHQAGFATQLAVRQQRTQLALSRTVLPDLRTQVRGRIYALGVLAGEPPEALQAQLTPPKAFHPVLVNVPPGLPSNLLRRRPDIRAAERALAASSADIGVAVARLYPQISLTGALGFVSLQLKNLLGHATGAYTAAAGALSLPIFSGGADRARIRIAKQQNLQALYAYQQTVYGALKDVEDALTRYANEKDRNRALQSALSSARATADLAKRQYQAGLTDFMPVLKAQSDLLATRMQLAQSDGALDRDLVSLYRALGGGWRATEP